MSKTFPVRILTPERSFFSGDAISVTLEGMDGQLTIMADHAQMVCALLVGQLRIRTMDEEKIAFHSKGFVDVMPGEVLILCQACEWPEEIDVARAQMAAERANQRLREAGNEDEISRSKVAVLRALARLRTKESSERRYGL